MKKIPLILLALGIAMSVAAQITPPPRPQFKNQSPIGVNNGRTSVIPKPSPYGSPQVQRQNQAIIQQAQERQRRQRQSEREQIMSEIRSSNPAPAVRYEFPDLSHIEGTEFFREAYEEIRRMLAGQQDLSLKRAVFLVENAYTGNQLSYDRYEADIQRDTQTLQTLIRQADYDLDNPTARKWALQQIMSDTVAIKNANGDTLYIHLPYRYDFKDPWGKEDWTKQFVTKLLRYKKGQCHSLPLLYLILAEEMDIEAWLAYSPSHSYVKVKDQKGTLLNYETTNGYYTTDVWVQSSGYIKAEALRSRIYMDTLSKKEVVAATLADLAKGYAIKYGFDDFVEDCLDTTLEYSPDNIYALQIQSDYQTYLFKYVIDQLRLRSSEQLPEYPKAHELYLNMHQKYQYIDAIGYEEMPQEVYEQWLQSFESEKAKHPERFIKP